MTAFLLLCWLLFDPSDVISKITPPIPHIAKAMIGNEGISETVFASKTIGLSDSQDGLEGAWFERFAFGHRLCFRNNSKELEFFGWDGVSWQPILTLIVDGSANYVQIRHPQDTNSVTIGFQVGHTPYLSTEFAGTDFKLCPQGNLLLSPIGGVVMVGAEPLDKLIDRKIKAALERPHARPGTTSK